MHRNICKHDPLGFGEPASDEMQARQGDNRISQASKAVNQNPLYGMLLIEK
jgi:hypothetical protein